MVEVVPLVKIAPVVKVTPAAKAKFKEELRLKAMLALADEVYAGLPAEHWVDVETYGTKLNKKSTPMKLAFGMLLATNRLKITEDKNGARVVKKI
ncbi:MAG: hypothetical protein V1722_03050 [Candidatus Micrarchaeota archaeon]